MRFLLAAVFLVAACTPVTTAPGGSLHFSGERVGAATVRLTLDNGTTSQVGYNLCSSELQRITERGWTRVDTDDVCTMELRTLNPGADATFEKQLPPDLASGEYRYVTGVESPLGGSRVVLSTPPFSR